VVVRLAWVVRFAGATGFLARNKKQAGCNTQTKSKKHFFHQEPPTGFFFME